MFCIYKFASCLVVCITILHLQFAFRLQFVASSIFALSYFRVLVGILACLCSWFRHLLCVTLISPLQWLPAALALQLQMRRHVSAERASRLARALVGCGTSRTRLASSRHQPQQTLVLQHAAFAGSCDL